MQVQLISKEEPPKSNNSRTEYKNQRPASVTIPKEKQHCHRWRQCKIIGKNVSIRSYGAACEFQNRLYLYGGYQILKGSLGDFYSISLEQTEQTFNWVEIVPKSNVNPGSREKHALMSTKAHLYLIGGLMSNSMASNEIFKFDPATSEWQLVKPEGAELPHLQSFGAGVVDIGGQERIIIAFGFNQETAGPSNAVYEFNTVTNKLSVLYEGSAQAGTQIPAPRIGCALSFDKSNMYIFGGKNQSSRLNDLWSFSLTDYKFKKLPAEGQIPAIRNGHSMTIQDDKLYVFGGIHDITWELDDLHIYNLKTNKWTTLEHDSPRKVEKKKGQQSIQLKEKEKISPKKKGWYETMGNVYPRGSSPKAVNRNFSTTINQDRAQSPGKMLDEQRRKVFFQKKAEMLHNFDVSKDQAQKYLALQTSSQAMKISLDVIGNPDPKVKVSQNRLTDFGKQSQSKFLGPLTNSNNIILGKKPCARDGHCAVLMNQSLIICCGDRHQMSFNDIYKLDLSKAKETN